MDITQFETKLRKQYSDEHSTPFKFIQKKLFDLWLFKRLFRKEVESTYTMTEEQCYTKLDETVSWYQQFGSAAHPDELLDSRDMIVTCSYWLSQKLTDVISKYNLKVQHNKLEIDRVMSQTSSTTKTTTARANAKAAKGSELMQEANYKSEISRLEKILESLANIDKAMQQRIAWLRQEAFKNPQV